MGRFFGTIAMAGLFAYCALGQLAAGERAMAAHNAKIQCYEAAAGGLVANVEECK